jgi:hypothetical protein
MTKLFMDDSYLGTMSGARVVGADRRASADFDAQHDRTPGTSIANT